MASRIDSLTEAQKARMPEWRDKWIAIGLRTGEADWKTFELAVKVAYEKTKLPQPKVIIRVQSPIVGAFAAPIADKLIQHSLRGAVDEAVDGAVRGAVDGAVRGAVDGAVREAVDGAVGEAVDEAVDGAVREAVDGAVGEAVDGAVRGAVDGAVREAVDEAVDEAVRGAVDGAVRGAVGEAVDEAVDGAVGGAVREGWYKYIGGQFWVGGWYWGSPSYVSFFTEICSLELSEDISERAKAYQNIAQSVCWWWPYRDFVMVCNHPSVIHRDINGQLHSEAGKAIEWPDGWGFHVLHGIRFDKNPELWKKIVSGTLTAEELSNIQDVDQRRIAMTYLKGEDFIKQMKAKLVDTGQEIAYEHLPNRRIRKVFDVSTIKNTKKCIIVVNRLYKIPAGEVYEKDKYFLFYLNPSTGEEHLSFVTNYIKEVGEDADACMSWKHNCKNKQEFLAGLGA